MTQTTAFETEADRYDQWFVRHDTAYFSELSAVRRLLPQRGLGIEIGVGTGRFASALGIRIGVDPSVNMLQRAHGRDLTVVRGIAEALPFRDGTFDYGLIVTTICFVDDAGAMMCEARRILKPGGDLVIGFIDRESPLGRRYLAGRSENVFYRNATFYSSHDVELLLTDTGFGKLTWAQTLFEVSSDRAPIESARPGYGEGSFVVVRATCLR
jgi:SAM-dependent methyltransferase